MRTIEIEYVGSDGPIPDSLFDAVVEAFERHGLAVESSSDGPTEDVSGL